MIEDPYLQKRVLASGEVIGLQKFMFTLGLCYGVSNDPMDLPYKYRFCYSYSDISDAMAAYKDWDGKGIPEGNWVKCKGAGIEYRNPRLPKDKYEMTEYQPNYDNECSVCGMDHTVTIVENERLVQDIDLCGVCTWGEAAMLDPDKWNEPVE